MVSPVGFTQDGRTRTEVVKLLLEEGPISASAIGRRLGLSAAGVRRHLDALIELGEARTASPIGRQQRGRGRPAKLFQLTEAGRARLNHAYDDLAGAAMRRLREVGGDEVIVDFAKKRIDAIVHGAAEVPDGAEGPVRVEAVAENIAGALTSAGFAASTRRVGNGVQICQHHCPVSHVASEFPELCEAEIEAFRELLGTHVQRLATIANGDCACTTHVPLGASPGDTNTPHRQQTPNRKSGAQPAPERTSLRKELA
ncbi:transcriptional regulator [Rhodococcus sp. D2-41]|uniref:Transcriptional regulator n=1 Tax=Speluncibacter jeojiensis TaxID=2710754 RepID=A0A9X4M628_9ACTN|nr:metalloregulator ArsR/SmtB family transcription factor [Rhodococcus sp. D2-41]MDG3011215.1 transcriptional regulator [Rhodococcus sp. D2-41]MDG3015933.1 transcriptional regulator [Corynebacteriales bacterium D3-21]